MVAPNKAPATLTPNVTELIPVTSAAVPNNGVVLPTPSRSPNRIVRGAAEPLRGPNPPFAGPNGVPQLPLVNPGLIGSLPLNPPTSTGASGPNSNGVAVKQRLNNTRTDAQANDRRNGYPARPTTETVPTMAVNAVVNGSKVTGPGENGGFVPNNKRNNRYRSGSDSEKHDQRSKG